MPRLGSGQSALILMGVANIKPKQVAKYMQQAGFESKFQLLWLRNLVILRSAMPSNELLKAAYAKFGKYKAWLEKQPFSAHSRRAYRSRVNHYLVFLSSANGEYSDALDDPKERDFAVRDYKLYLKRTLKMQPTSVNSALTAIDSFYQYLGMEPVKVKREDLPQLAPRALSKEEQKRFVRAAERCRRPKDRAVALLLCYTGIRIGECAALDVDDVSVFGRKNRVTIRSGKGEKYRVIPLHSEAVEDVSEWLIDRGKKFKGKSTDNALFVNPQGRRISTASLDLIVRKIGRECGLELSAHVLRHTFLTSLVRGRNDLVLVAEIAGHKRLETTRRYTLPTEADRERAIEAVVVDE